MTAVHEARGRGAAVDVLDHGTSGDIGEGFGREAGRLVSRRNDRDHRGFSQFERQTDRHSEVYHERLIRAARPVRRTLAPGAADAVRELSPESPDT